MSKLDPVYLVLAVIASFGLGVIVTDKPPEIITVVETVEVPVIITDTVTIIETVEIPQPFPVYINNTKTERIYVPTGAPLIDFPSKNMLLSWINEDSTETIPYSGRWTCMDYTLRSIHNAEQAGFRIYFVFWDSKQHAVCMAYCVKENQYVIWEPQTDQILWTWDSWPTS